jgi:hypothetical protein
MLKQRLITAVFVRAAVVRKTFGPKVLAGLLTKKFLTILMTTLLAAKAKLTLLVDRRRMFAGQCIVPK